MGAFLAPIIVLVVEILEIYKWIVIIAVVTSWLLTLGVLTTANHVVRGVIDVLYRLTEPVYRPFRRFIPNFGGLDITPLIVLLIIWLVQAELATLAAKIQTL
ncbi:MAG TPA: YggT family protein [Stellaceae bacterium]|nr:YggT family protein [Stellaceae bacterium]